MKEKKMLLFSDYVKDKEECESKMTILLSEFCEKYKVTLKGLAVDMAPSFGSVPEVPEHINVVIK